MKVIILKGLPASGKSTYAKELVAQGYKCVSKDNLRAMLDDKKHSKSNEKFILLVRDFLIRESLMNGKNVVVDDTNLNPIHEERIKEIVRQINNPKIQVEVKEFNTPLLECIRRDKEREAPVGEKVIREMARRWMPIIPNDAPLNPVGSLLLPPAFIVDFDGTLATMRDRSPYDYSKVSNDIPNNSVIHAVQALSEKGFRIIILSGRKEMSKKDSIKWLKEYEIDYNEIHFRGDEDNRKDAVFKEEKLNELITRYRIIGVFDDRQSVVDMWRARGITCFQVNYGNF